MKTADSFHYSRADIAAALAVFAVVLVFFLFYMDSFVLWGDDFAAYLSEGIAIAEGRFAEQTALNPFLHPTELPDAAGDTLVYAWGYSLVLALVYKLVGYDPFNLRLLVYYKLPTVLCLALCAGLLFLLLRRRFPFLPSALLALVFGLSREFFEFSDTLYGDVFFLLLTVLTFFLAELFLASRAARARWALSALLGLALFFTQEARLNGVVVCVCVAFAQLVWLLRNRTSLTRALLCRHLLPWLIYAVLRFVFEALLLAPPTSNSGDLALASLAELHVRFSDYKYVIHRWFSSLWRYALFGVLPGEALAGRLSGLFASLSLLLVVVGVLTDGIKRNAHLTLYAVITLCGVLLLPHWQGLRYLYSVLPLLLLFFCYGARRLLHTVSRLLRLPAANRAARGAALALSALLCVCLVFQQCGYLSSHAAARTTAFVSTGGNIYLQNAFSDQALEAYRFLRENTPEDSVIAFDKPRLLYLNTGRLSFADGVNGHRLDEADYVVAFTGISDLSSLPPTAGQVFQNAQLTVYALR